MFVLYDIHKAIKWQNPSSLIINILNIQGENFHFKDVGYEYH